MKTKGYEGPLPALHADTVTMAKLLNENFAVTTGQISETFHVSMQTARKAVSMCLEYAGGKGGTLPRVGRSLMVPVDVLFEVYGWDKKKVLAKARAAEKRREKK